jgi:hypothetical protein
MEAMRRIPAARLEKFLNNEEFFLELDVSDYPIPLKEREALLGDMPWTVFTTIARAAADPTLESDAVIQRVKNLAGFDRIKEVLEQRFFQRSQLLCCHRILNDASQILKTIKFKHLPTLRKRDREERARQGRFLNFLRRAAPLDPEIVRELEALVQERGTKRAEQVEVLLEELERDFGSIDYQLDQYSADFEALHQIGDSRDSFSPDELEELQALLGLYGTVLEKRLPPDQISLEYVTKRQITWREVTRDDANPLRRDVAQQVVYRYGFLLEEILKRTTV